jgi:hypothetical protein
MEQQLKTTNQLLIKFYQTAEKINTSISEGESVSAASVNSGEAAVS